MFGFLKDKLKSAVKKFSREAEEEVKEEKVESTEQIEKAKEEEKKTLKRPQKEASTPKKPKQVPQKKEQPPKEVQKPQAKEKTEEKTSRETAPQSSPQEQAPSHTKHKEPEPAESPVQQSDPTPLPEKKKGFLGKLFGKKEPEKGTQKKPELEEATQEPAHEQPEKEELAKAQEEPTQEQEIGFLGKLKDSFTKKTLSQEKFDELFWELELAMLENNVAVEVIEKIKEDLKEELTSGKINRIGIEDMILLRLQKSIEELLDVESFDLIERIKTAKKPFKLCIIGVNGSGKTTSLAKLIHLLKQHDLSVVVAASDTFRAAAIDQLKEHTDKLGVKLISQGYGADPAAVAFDAIKHAEAQGIDVVLIDTAGRLHSNTNLMAELEKVVRVNKPDLKIFVGESITGNDCVEQAKVFNSLVGIDAIILSKADIDEKGGAAISVSHVTGKPILYLGTGQTYDDLEPFEKEKILRAVGL